MKRPMFKKIVFCLGLLTFCLSLLVYSLARAQLSPERTDARRVEYTSEALPDPFESPWERQKVLTEEPPTIGYDLPQLKVQGMVWGTEMPQAIINNTVVKIGEFVQGAEVIDIRREGIYVLYEGKQYIVRPVITK